MNKLQRIILKLKTKEQNRLKNKRGAELVESILMVGVAIALIVVVFYPQIMLLMNVGFSNMESWFVDALIEIGQPVI
ncbi:MAG: hypothetical protein PHD15_05515 [Clostridia bacterium]|nr:hypothetical protein [Clostridia bacterium]MDD4387191.1 hypothetical protein [Clostridia bacterium]